MKISMLTPAVREVTSIIAQIMIFANSDDENNDARNAGAGNHAGDNNVGHNEDEYKNMENDDAEYNGGANNSATKNGAETTTLDILVLIKRRPICRCGN